MKAILFRLFTMGGLTSALALVAALPALAHESREVGPYEFVVGWGDEPTFTGFMNSAQLILSDSETGDPILELGDEGIQVEVVFGDESTSLEMEPAFLPGVFGEPGDYRAHLIPTRAGEYSFRFTGRIDGVDVDETFTSGPETFDTPREAQDVQFPAQDPSNAQLAGRLDQEIPRLEQQLVDDVDGARLLALVGLGAGVLALVVASVALVRGGEVGETSPVAVEDRAGG